MAPILHLRLLGGPEIRLGKHPIHLETAKTLALLAYLVMRPGAHQREMLADLLWGDQGQARAARSLRRAVWNIRRSLCSDDESCPYLHVSRQDIAFNHQAPHTLDVETFEKHIKAIKPSISSTTHSASPEAIKHLIECVRLYRGDFMEGVYVEGSSAFETWLLGERAYYRERIIQVLFQLCKIHIARGEYGDAILTLQRLLTLAPWSEWAHRQLMLCYALAGRRADALAQYERCLHLLREHFHVDPLPETVRLYERIRDPHQFTRILFQPDRSPGDLLPPIPFFGREEEHAWLMARWEERQGTLTLVEGEAGIGKTRLMEEFLKYLRGRGVTALRGCCYQFSSSASFHPFADALRNLLHRAPDAWSSLAPVWLVELSRLLPELQSATSALPPPVPIEKDTAARQRLFEAVAQAFLALAQGGLAFFLDDAHWADADTVDMLRYLLHRLADANIWFVAAYRGEEVEPGHPFNLLCRDLGRTRRLQILHLSPLSQESIRQALAEWLVLPKERIPSLLTYLYDRSQGNPFILMEHLRDLVERGILQARGTGWDVDADQLREEQLSSSGHGLARHVTPRTVPSAVQDMVLTRVGRLPTDARHLLDIAAVLGEPFTRELLLAIAQTPAQQVDAALSTWLLRGLIRPISSEQEPCYDFTHPLICQVVYHHIPDPIRRHLHAHIGATLAHLYAGREDQIIEALAYHFAESADREKAVHYLLQAGEAAQSRQAQEAAVGFYSHALEMIPAHDRETRYRALSGRERAYNQLARREEQARDLTELENLAHALADPIRQADVLLRRAEWAMRTARFREGIDSAEAAHSLARKHGDIGLAVDALRIKAMCHVRTGDFGSGLVCCEEGLHLSQQIGDRRREVLCLGTLGIIDLDQNRLPEALQHMEAALAYWRESGEAWHQAIACNNLSMLYHRLGNYGRALALQEEARNLIPQTGDLGLDAYSLTSQGVLYYTLGRYEDALACYEDARRLAHIISDQGLESYIQTCAGETHLAQGDVDEAEAAYRRALAIEEDLNAFVFRSQIWEGLARCALARGGLAEAAERLEKADHYYRSTRAPGHTMTLALYAYVQVQQVDVEAARALVTQFREAEEAAGGEAEPEAWWWLAQTLNRLNQPAAAREALVQAATIIRQRAASLDERARTRYLSRSSIYQDILTAAPEEMPGSSLIGREIV